MGIESIANVIINIGGSGGIDRAGFNVPMIVGHHTKFTARTKTYSSQTALEDLITDGFSTHDPIYRKVQSVISSTPRPKTFILGKTTGTWTHKGTLTVVSDTPVAGDVYALSVKSPAGEITAISHTVTTETATAVATALAAALNAISGITSTSAAGVVSWESDDDNVEWILSGFNTKQLLYADTTIDPVDHPLAEDLAAIKVADNSWYGLILADAPSNARNIAVATWTETQEKVFFALTRDSINQDDTNVNSLAYLTRAADYFRTNVMYSEDFSTGADSAWVGEGFPYDPGSSTWAYKTLAGVTVDPLDEDGQAGILKNNANIYIRVAGASVTMNGTTASGEWIDVIIFRDYLVARLRESFLGLLKNNRKIPYTNKGRELILSAILAVLQTGVAVGGLDDSEEYKPWASGPDVSEIDVADRAARHFPRIKFGARLAGAVHTIDIVGELMV